MLMGRSLLVEAIQRKAREITGQPCCRQPGLGGHRKLKAEIAGNRRLAGGSRLRRAVGIGDRLGTDAGHRLDVIGRNLHFNSRFGIRQAGQRPMADRMGAECGERMAREPWRYHQAP